MEWIVRNAISRDVERQQLNKILKEIRNTLDEVVVKLSGSGSTVDDAKVRAIVANMLAAGDRTIVQGSYNSVTKGIDWRVRDFTLTLTGDVTGSGLSTNLGNVSVTTAIAEGAGGEGIGEAPLDGLAYWRAGGNWEVAPFPAQTLQFLIPPGITAIDEDLNWYARTIEGTATEIDVTDGDGIAGNPVLSVAPEIRQGVSRVPLTADGIIHGRRAVSVDAGLVYHPDLAVPEDALKIYGISAQAATDGEPVEVHTQGPMTDASWTWVSGPVYADDEGVLTQTAPATGWIVNVGTATAADTIDVHIHMPILRS